MTIIASTRLSRDELTLVDDLGDNRSETLRNLIQAALIMRHEFNPVAGAKRFCQHDMKPEAHPIHLRGEELVADRRVLGG